MFGRDRLIKQVLRQRFVVTQKSGPMFSALLVDADRRTFRFGDVSVLGDSGTERPAAPGELYIDRANVAYMQQVYRSVKE